MGPDRLDGRELATRPDPALDRYEGLVRRLLRVPVATVSVHPSWDRPAPDGDGARADVPLSDAEGHVLGSLSAVDTRERSWSDDDLEILRDIAEACSTELRLRIETARARAARDAAREVRRSLERSRARFSLLASASGALSSTLNAGEVLERLGRLAVPALADWCVSWTVSGNGPSDGPGDGPGSGPGSGPGRLQLRSGVHRDDASGAELDRFLALLPARPGEGAVVWRATSSGRPVNLPTAMASDLVPDPSDEVRDLIDTLGLGSVLAVPVGSPTGPTGGLLLVSSARERYDDDAVAIAADLAVRTGIALDNARLYGQQRRASALLQQSLLTALPVVEGARLAARYQPAADDVAVGGDWYDAFTTRDGALYLVIGDVVGHDLEAAAAMGRVKQLVQAIAFDREEPPAAVLHRVDQALAGLGIATFASAVVARLDPPGGTGGGARRLLWANAGHPPPLVHVPGRGVMAIEDRPELILGHSAPPRQDHEAWLAPGSTLLLYTDGLVERRGSPLDAGLARLRRTLVRMGDLDLPELCDVLLNRLVPGRSEDDVAILALRTSP